MFIELYRAVWDAFERVVDREYDRVGVDLGEGTQQRGGREVARGGGENLRAKVVAQLVFAHTQARALSAVEVTWTGGKPLEITFIEVASRHIIHSRLKSVAHIDS